MTLYEIVGVPAANGRKWTARVGAEVKRFGNGNAIYQTLRSRRRGARGQRGGRRR